MGERARTGGDPAHRLTNPGTGKRQAAAPRMG